jgi:hypothetical protein
MLLILRCSDFGIFDAARVTKVLLVIKNPVWKTGFSGGEYRGRTDDLLHAMQAL